MRSVPRLGILGGMGPLAGVHLAERIIHMSNASNDQEHMPFVLWSDPQIPDRVEPIISGKGASPVPAMLEGIHALVSTDVDAIAIACNTAHFWYEELQAASGIPILHIVDAAISELETHDLRRGSEDRGTIYTRNRNGRYLWSPIE